MEPRRWQPVRRLPDNVLQKKIRLRDDLRRLVTRLECRRANHRGFADIQRAVQHVAAVRSRHRAVRRVANLRARRLGIDSQRKRFVVKPVSVAEGELGQLAGQGFTVGRARRWAEKINLPGDQRGRRVETRLPIGRHAIRNVIPLLGVFHDEVMHHCLAVRLHEAKVLAARAELEISVQLPVRLGPVFAGCKHQQITAGLDLHGRKHPLGQVLRIVSQRPTGQVDRGIAGIEKLDPICVVAIGVLQVLVVDREKFANDHSGPRLAKRWPSKQCGGH